MSKRLATAALAVAGLAFSAPAALADRPTYDCLFRSAQEDMTTYGGSFRAALAGIIVHANDHVSIRCRLSVDDVPVAETSASGDSVAVTAREDMSFVSEDLSVVRVCADFTSAHRSGTTCRVIGTSTPPRLVTDAIDDVQEQVSQVWPVVDPPVCAALMALAPGVGPVFVNSQGDVYVDGEPQWDCSPYDVVWP